MVLWQVASLLKIYSGLISICALFISLASFAVSIWLAWLTHFNRGELKMTRPTLIVMMHDILAPNEILPKIFLRTLLYSTGLRGHIIENMYLTVHHGDTSQNFCFWGYGEPVTLGSGLRVDSNGVVHDHHFNPPKNAVKFQFHPGKYRLEIYGHIANPQKKLLLSVFDLSLTEQQAIALQNPRAKVYFEWWPDTNTYNSHIE